ncbi:hypothetical protein HFP15_11760 [Amycolatopsis sp. K13G38]|uniref:Uncharacterized protein n=1 Tax=Amycolatopsis acididurans TaxID=2724524 RepID=A0ABX1J1A6_9PSEU|nr:hypothetical protein [Amycolatopsis acididurans]NKQ53556.1 hypothetical protein [Amycolatopsis acididurans]
MGTIYCGPLAEQADTYSHEGYAARILPNGAETGTWNYATREFTGYRAHCDCGWRGTTTYPPTDRGEELADGEWDRDHLRPLIDAEAQRHTVTAARLLALTRSLRASLPTTVDEQGRQVLTERGRGALDVVQSLEQLLDELPGE